MDVNKFNAVFANHANYRYINLYYIGNNASSIIIGGLVGNAFKLVLRNLSEADVTKIATAHDIGDRHPKQQIKKIKSKSKFDEC